MTHNALSVLCASGLLITYAYVFVRDILRPMQQKRKINILSKAIFRFVQVIILYTSSQRVKKTVIHIY